MKVIIAAGHQALLTEYAVHTGWSDGHDIGVQHHQRQTPIAFLRVLGMELDDRFFLPVIEPRVTRDFGVVLIRLAIAGPPVVELNLLAATPSQRMNLLEGISVRLNQ